MAFQFTSDQRCYAQVTHPYDGFFPHSSGASTVAGTDIIPLIDFKITGDAGLIDSAAKTIGLGRSKGMAGRRTARWEATFPWQPSGAAGTVPNLDQVLQALFGQAPTVVASTSVTYAFSSSASPSQLSFFIFRTAGSNVYQYAIRGAIVDTFSLPTSDGEAQLRIGGPCAGVIDSVNFASYSTEDKGGLTAFPTEPGSPTTVGTSIVGFLGANISINSVTSHTIQGWEISGALNRGLQPAFNQRTPSVPTARLREISGNLAIFEENTAALAALRIKWLTSAAIPLVLKLDGGGGAGSISTFNLGTVVLPAETLDDIDGLSVVRFNGFRAYISAVGSNDELTIALT